MFLEKRYAPDIEFTRKIEIENIPHYLYSNVQILYEKVFPCDILITHTPPLLPEDIEYRNSSSGVYELVSRYRPLLCVSGHVHKPNEHIMRIPWDNCHYDVSETTLINLGSLDEGIVILLELHKKRKMVVNYRAIHIEFNR